MTNTEQKQINILKALVEKGDKIFVFQYAELNNLNKQDALKTAEYLAKKGFLNISPEKNLGDGDKLMWSNFKSEKVIENPSLLKDKPNIIVEKYTNSTVIKGNNSGNQSVFSNTSLNVSPAQNPTKKTKKNTISKSIINFLKWFIPVSISLGILYYASK